MGRSYAEIGVCFVRISLTIVFSFRASFFQMSTFSIGEADEEDDFAQLRNTKTTASTARDGRVTKLGAVPLKSSEPATGEFFVRCGTHPSR